MASLSKLTSIAADCPQLRDGEPEKSGRSCPLDWGIDDEF